MSTTVEAGAHWAKIKDTGELVKADRDKVRSASGVSASLNPDDLRPGMSPDQLRDLVAPQVKFTQEMITHQQNVTLAVLITDWNLGAGLPSAVEDLRHERQDGKPCEVCAAVGAIPLDLADAIEDHVVPHLALFNRVAGAGKAVTSSISSNGSKAGARRPRA